MTSQGSTIVSLVGIRSCFPVVANVGDTSSISATDLYCPAIICIVIVHYSITISHVTDKITVILIIQKLKIGLGKKKMKNTLCKVWKNRGILFLKTTRIRTHLFSTHYNCKFDFTHANVFRFYTFFYYKYLPHTSPIVVAADRISTKVIN